jgi:hypothetical protein
MKSSNTTTNLLLVIFFIIAFTIISIVTAKGQSINSPDYRNAIGLRGGYPSGLTFKHFSSGTTAWEGILGVWHRALSLTILYEKHASAFDVSGMRWYYGGGGHVAFATSRRYYDDRDGRYYYRYYRDDAAFGIDGIIGLEYKIPPIPFAISLDLKPTLEVTTGGAAYFDLDPGLGLKFTF